MIGLGVALGKQARLCAVCVLAAVGGVGAVLAVPASASASGPTVTAFAVPSSDYSAPVSSAVMPMAPGANGQGEWFLVNDSSGAALLQERISGGSPTLVEAVGAQPGVGAPSFTALVATHGLDYGLSDIDIYSFPPAGSPTIAPLTPVTPRDMTVGPDGNLWWTDNGGNIDREFLDRSGNLSPGPEYSVPSQPFASPAPDAIASAGGKVWFTTNNAELGSLSPTGTFAASFGGPYGDHGADGPASQFPHTLVGAGNYLWAVGGGLGTGAGGSEILQVDPSNGSVLSTYGTAAGMPAGAKITSLTSGPDGNIWFTDSGTQAIGELDLGSGKITELPFPTGYRLPSAGGDVIAAGPTGSHTLFFGAETFKAGTITGPAIGEITNVGGQTVTKPHISGASLGSKSFKAKKGTTLKLTLSTPASVKVVITHIVTGHKVKGVCKAHAKRGKKCTIEEKVKTLNFKGVAGSNSFKLLVKNLRPGSYTAEITASDRGGTSNAVTLKFKIKK